VKDAAVIAERFVIDESGFEFHDEDAAVLESTLRRFLDVLDYARETGQGIARWSQIWHIEAANGRSLSDLLYATNEIDRDVRLLVGMRLDKVRSWDEDLSINPPCDVKYGDKQPKFAPSIGLCLMAAQQRHGLACLTTDQVNLRAFNKVATGDGMLSGSLCFLVYPSDGPTFWRSIVELEDADESQLASLSHLAFPRLRFAALTWSQVSRFEGDFRDLRALLLRDLSGLNDHALDVWRNHIEPVRIAAEMRARAGVNCSRDSYGTHRNATAMSERLVRFGGVEVKCEWHTKLERHRNRIHFAVIGDEVFVGIFASHLTT
jgi:hypothetical protein